MDPSQQFLALERIADLAARLERALPLRSEEAAPFAAGLMAFCTARDREPLSLTLTELLDAAEGQQPDALRDQWYAVGKCDGSWYAVAPASHLQTYPLVQVARGRRRRILAMQDLAGARPFSTAGAARAAGRLVFARTYVIAVRAGRVLGLRREIRGRRAAPPHALSSISLDPASLRP